MRNRVWTAADIHNQTGRTFLITGANSGLGLEATKALTAKGARVIMACRNLKKAEQARAQLPAEQQERAEIRQLDLSDLESVRAFVSDLVDPDSPEKQSIDVLINNAGVMNTPLRRTVQGHELLFGTNVLGHFALTQGLLPIITDRVVWLGSSGHYLGRINLDDLDWRSRRYNSLLAYADSKLACIMLAYELQRRFESSNSPLKSLVAHPGFSATNLLNRRGNALLDGMMNLINSLPVAQTPDKGALPELYAATVSDLPGGTYVGPDGFLGLQGYPTIVTSKKLSHNVDIARALWQRCEELSR